MILAVLIGVFFLPGLLLVIFSALDFMVAKDPRITDKPYKALYQTHGTLSTPDCNKLEVSTSPTTGGWEMSVRRCNEVTAFPLDEKGKLQGKEAYSFFWIFLENPVIRTPQQATRNLQVKVSDPSNILADRDEAGYTMKITEPFILWSPVLQSQASYRMGVYDSEGKEMATAVVDSTCGLLFELTTHVRGAGRAELIKTDFPISRNRVTLMRVATAAAVILMIIAAIRYWRAPLDLKEKRNWEMRLILYGVLACYIDIYPDVWWPFAFGAAGLLLLHAAALLPGLIWTRWWILPGLVEIAWATTFMIQTERVVPQLTHSPGLILSWMTAALFMRIRRTPQPEKPADNAR